MDTDQRTPFVPDGFVPPAGLATPDFVLEPLGPQHNDSDHDAWTSSIEHIWATPGYPDGRWPYPMTLEQNRADLERHQRDFVERKGFTYTVLDPGSRSVIGCVYIYPSKQPVHDAEVLLWVRATHAQLDQPLWRAVWEWVERDWPFRSVSAPGRLEVVATTERFRLQLLRPQDAEPLQRLYGDPEAMRYVGADGSVRTPEQTAAGVGRLIDHQQANGFSLWGVADRESGEVIGVAGLVLVELIGPDVEVVYELVPDAWGRGIATEVGRASLDVAFGPLGLERVVALSYPENAPSVRVMQKIGMRDDGEFEAYGRRMVRYVAEPVDSD
jgi:RimJ/RimL family protein N-acetyltransferase